MFLADVSINQGEKITLNAGMNALNQRITYFCTRQSLDEGNIEKKNPFKDIVFNNPSVIYFSGKYMACYSVNKYNFSEIIND